MEREREGGVGWGAWLGDQVVKMMAFNEVFVHQFVWVKIEKMGLVWSCWAVKAVAAQIWPRSVAE